MNRYTTKPDLLKMMQKYHQGTATEAEKAFVDEYYAFAGTRPVAGEQMEEAAKVGLQQEIEVWLLDYINTPKKALIKKPVIKLWPRIAAVAAAVAMVVFGVWFFNSDKILRDALDDKSVVQNDIAPGKNTATLTLADGKVIALDTNKSSVVVTDSVKTMTMLTATTPRGGTYQVTLPDGTKVWLNADSKISFPSQFTGKERKVLMQGEAYFEVAKLTRSSLRGRGRASSGNLSERVPFIVETSTQTIEVLGTHFNVTAYADEHRMITTLLEGKVKVKLYGDTMNLAPGDQAYSDGDGLRGLKTDDLEAVIAWKNGQFMFADEDLKSIMRKVARWYDVEIVYQEGFQNRGLVGTISKFENVSKVLKMLELTGTVHFKVEGRRITVMK